MKFRTGGATDKSTVPPTFKEGRRVDGHCNFTLNRSTCIFITDSVECVDLLSGLAAAIRKIDKAEHLNP